MTAVINKLEDNHQAHANYAVAGLRHGHQARCRRGNVAEGVVTPRLASGRPLGELQRFSGVISRWPRVRAAVLIAGEPDVGKHHLDWCTRLNRAQTATCRVKQSVSHPALRDRIEPVRACCTA